MWTHGELRGTMHVSVCVLPVCVHVVLVCMCDTKREKGLICMCVCFIKEGERDPWVCACVVHVEHVQAKTLNYKIDPATPISKTPSQLHEIET